MKKYLSLTIALMIAASVSACGTAANAASSAAEAQSVENAAELPEKSAENAVENQKSPENIPADQLSQSAPEEAAAAEDKTIASENEAGQEVPEEAIYDALGAEVYIDEEAPYYDSSDEEISTPPEVAGTYTLYAWDEHGEIKKPDEQNCSSTITLKEDGTGTMTFDEETYKIERWGVSGSMFAMFYDEHGAADGTLDDGIIIIDPIDNDDILFFYAKEGVDITEVLSADREEYILED